MASFDDYESHDGLGLAGLIRDRHTSAEEVLDAAIERVEARDGTVNAVTTRMSAAWHLEAPLRAPPMWMRKVC